MVIYIPHSILHLAGLLYVRPETFGPYYVRQKSQTLALHHVQQLVTQNNKHIHTF